MKKNYILYIFSLIFILQACKLSQKENPNSFNSELDTIVCPANVPLTEKEKNSIIDSIDGLNKAQNIKKFLDSAHQRVPFNGCIYIEQKKIPLYQKCEGVTCFKCPSEYSIDEHSTFQLASLSKTFTAILTLKLIQQGKFLITDTIQKFYPNFPYKGIDIKQLLCHRSGLPDYIYAFENKSRKKIDNPDNQLIMDWFEEFKPEKYRNPDRSFSYNNSNYMVLAAVIEKVLNKPFEYVLEQELFKPLKMKDSFTAKNKRVNEHITVGHENKKEISKDFFDDVLGDKGIYSSINDLKIWYRALSTGNFISKSVLDSAFSPQSFESKGVRNYGLGFRLLLDKESQKIKYVFHNGWWKGYNSLFWFDPTTETFICALTNEKNKSIYKYKGLINILIPNSVENEDDEHE